MMNTVELQHISKSFGSVQALTDASIRLEGGQTHVLLGENGAGKTTLMRILYGMMRPDSGKILVNNKEVHFKHNRDAIDCGIGMVHQHFMLVPSLTVAENVVLGIELVNKRRQFDFAKAVQMTQDLADKYNFRLKATDKVADLSVGLKQKVEILKALIKGAEILILDEPTAVLTPQAVSYTHLAVF